MSDTNTVNTANTPPAEAPVAPGKRHRYKRARSGYAFYASDKAVRATIQSAHPDWKFGEVSKVLGAQWKEMDETARQPYMDQSVTEKASLTCQPGPVHKRARSAYAFYMKDTAVRSAITQGHPGWSFGEVSKAIGEQWKKLSTEAKEPYTTISDAEKEKVGNDTLTTKTKRARSAYAFYMKDTSVRETIQAAHPGWSFGEVSKKLGEQWKALDESGRQTYLDQSATEKAEFKASVPTDLPNVTPGSTVKTKRARSAYAFYMKDASVRGAIQAAHTDWSFGEVSKEIGATWKALDESGRQPYLDQSNAEKAELLTVAPVAVSAPTRKKRARSAYNFYMMDASVREGIQTAHPEWKFGEVSKALGEQWKGLDATGRQAYVDKADEDKVKVTANTNADLSSTCTVEVEKPKGKKRARSGYAFYAADKSVREAIQKAHPEWKFGEVSKQLGAQWKEMDETARQPYMDQSNTEKASFVHSSVEASLVSLTKPSKAPKVKRGRSGYAFYAADKSVREAIQKAHPEWKFGEVSKQFGAQWKEMDEDARQPYMDQSKTEKAGLANSVLVATTKVATHQDATTKVATHQDATTKTQSTATKVKTTVKVSTTPTKRGRTAYNYYLMDKSVREAVQQAHPEWKFGEIVKELSANWKEMDEEAKEPYVQQATSPAPSSQASA